MSSRKKQLVAAAVVGALTLGLAACGNDDDSADATGTTKAPAAEKVTLRLGYFPNVTHAPAIVGVRNGIFEKALGSNVTLETKTFNAGPEAIEALSSGALDATYIGPNPAINAWAKTKSEGGLIRIVAGSTSGGAALVVKPEITSAAQLKGKKIASPQLGNTQDVALRSWLKSQGLETTTSGGGDVSIVPQQNADTLAQFTTGAIDGGWVPEPWATRLVQEGKGKVLVDEKTLWPGGRFVTTHLIVRNEFLKKHPDAVKRLVQGHVDAVQAIADDPAAAKKVTNEGIGAITGKPLKQEVIDAAWGNLEFTDDPIASSLEKSAAAAESLGFIDKVDLTGIYALTDLNAILKKAGRPAVEGL